ncbi:hypothetical protein [Micromonospora sp. NPDC007220]
MDGSALPRLLVVATNAVRSEWRSARRWLSVDHDPVNRNAWL